MKQTMTEEIAYAIMQSWGPLTIRFVFSETYWRNTKHFIKRNLGKAAYTFKICIDARKMGDYSSLNGILIKS